VAAVTHRVATTSTSNVATYASGSFTPANGELLVALVVASGTVDAGDMTDSIGGTWTKITSALNQASADTIYVFVRTALIGTGVSMTVTFDCTGDNATGVVIFVAGVSGMAKVGAAAVRQSDITENTGAGTTPSITFPAVCLTTNPTIVVIGNATNPAGCTPPTNWTELGDTGHATPDRGGEYAHRDSGFTGTTITWGAASPSAWGAIGIELDTSAGTTFNQNNAGGITPAGALVKSPLKVLAGANTPAGALVKQATKIVAGAVTSAGALVKRTSKFFAGTVTPTGALASARVIVKNIDGALTPAGELLKQTLKVLAGANTPAGALVRSTNKFFAGSMTPTGALSAVRVILQSIAGTIGPTGALRLVTGKVLSGAITSAGTLARTTARALAGAITPTGALASVKTKFIALVGAITPAGDSNGVHIPGSGPSVDGVLTRVARVSDHTDMT
jgi:hypothetical protein